MIKNIWANLDKILQYLEEHYTDVEIFVWKPIFEKEWKYIYFEVMNNNTLIENDNWWKIRKRGNLLFYFIWEKNTPDVEMYEMLDKFTNSVLTYNNLYWPIVIDWFEFYNFFDNNQTWIMIGEKDRKIITAIFSVDYKYKY